MIEKENFPTNDESEKSNIPFVPISLEKADQIKRNLAESFKLNPIRHVVVKIYEPGDDQFDIIEIQLKLRKKCASEQDLENLLLLKYNFNVNAVPEDYASIFRDIAKKEDIYLNGIIPAYICISKNPEKEPVIEYYAIAQDNILNLANSYAKKEGVQENFGEDSHEEAERFLAELAQKYLYHEIGHFIYEKYLNKEVKEFWDQEVTNNKDLVNKIVDIQSDKYASPEDIPTGDEVFAEFFTEVSGGGKNRLGNYSEYLNYMKEILASLTERSKKK